MLHRHPHVTFTGCTAHMLDLLLEDIGKLDWVKPVIDQARAVVKLIKGTGKTREVYRELNGKALLLPGTEHAPPRLAVIVCTNAVC